MSPTTHTLFQCNPKEEIWHFHPGDGGKEGNQQIHGGGFAPRSNLLPFLNTLFGEKGPLFVYLLLITITLFTYLV